MERTDSYKEIKLFPGQLFISSPGGNERIWTVLGSCVAVVIYHTELRAGAICHGQLPEESADGLHCSVQCPYTQQNSPPHQLTPTRFRFVSCALHYMLHSMRNLGPGDRLRAMVFGGSSIFRQEKSFFDVAGKNLSAARKILENESIPVVAERAGGSVSRSLYFYIKTGTILLKTGNKTEELSFITGVEKSR